MRNIRMSKDIYIWVLEENMQKRLVFSKVAGCRSVTPLQMEDSFRHWDHKCVETEQ